MNTARSAHTVTMLSDGKILVVGGVEANAVIDTELYDANAPEAEYGISINDGNIFTNQVTVTLTINARPGTAEVQVSNDGGFTDAVWESYTRLMRKPWQITQYGNFVIPRVVYVRYHDSQGHVTSTFQDDIILDVTPPTGSVSIVSPVITPTMRLEGTAISLTISATDDVSGVGEMMLSNHADFIGANWQAYTMSAIWTLDANNTVYVRFKDNAGNISATIATKEKGMLYLPLIIR